MSEQEAIQCFAQGHTKAEHGIMLVNAQLLAAVRIKPFKGWALMPMQFVVLFKCSPPHDCGYCSFCNKKLQSHVNMVILSIQWLHSSEIIISIAIQICIWGSCNHSLFLCDWKAHIIALLSQNEWKHDYFGYILEYTTPANNLQHIYQVL